MNPANHIPPSPHHHETFYVDDLMNELRHYAAAELQKYGKSNVSIELCKLTDVEKYSLPADRSLLRQIFICLLDNAVQSTKTGCIFFGYHISDVSTRNNITFFVDDTGYGTFNETDPNYTKAQELIRQSGGKIEVRPSNIAGISVHFKIA